jgi:hypothetical protein
MFLCTILLLYWLFINRNVIGGFGGINDIKGLLILNSSHSGYNFSNWHYSIYAIAFLLLLIISLPNFNIQWLVRMNRKSYLRFVIREGSLLVAIFVTCFISINMLLNTIYVNFSLLIYSNYFIGSIIQWVLLYLYYAMVGMLFILVYILFSSKTKALFMTVGVLTSLLVIKVLFGMWTLINDTIIFNDLFIKGLDLFGLLFKVIKNTLVLFCLIFISYEIFLTKDVFNNADA